MKAKFKKIQTWKNFSLEIYHLKPLKTLSARHLVFMDLLLILIY